MKLTEKDISVVKATRLNRNVIMHYKKGFTHIVLRPVDEKLLVKQVIKEINEAAVKNKNKRKRK